MEKRRLQDLLSEFLEDDTDLGELGDGEILRMDFDFEERMVDMTVSFSKFMERNRIFCVEQAMTRSKLRLRGCRIHPKFPAECLAPEVFPYLVEELSLQHCNVNGTLNDAKVRIEGDNFIITLAHGGYSIIEAKHFDKELARLIREEFGVGVVVDFDGTPAEIFPKVAEAIKPALSKGNELEFAKADFKLLKTAEKLVAPFYKKS